MDPMHHRRFEGGGRRYDSTAEDGNLREVQGPSRQQRHYSLRDEGKRKPTRDGHDQASDERRKRQRRTAKRHSLSRSRSRSSSSTRSSSRHRKPIKGQSDNEVVKFGSSRREHDQRHLHHRDRDRRKQHKPSSSERHSDRRQRRRRQHHRRGSSDSSESSRSLSEHLRVARPKAWLVSDDDDAGHTDKHHGGLGSSHAHNISNHNSQVDTRHKKPIAKSSWTEKGGVLSSLTRDDSVGHFLGGPGTVIADTYRVERDLGLGTFGRVVECLDLKMSSRRDDNRRRTVAIKMVRKVKRYYDSAVIEAGIVYDVNRRGGRGASHFAIMYDRFNWLGHYCLVFESLGPSLFDYLKRNKYKPFPINYIRDFSVQLLEAIDFLHSFRLIHTDCK
jgi:Protein kinase domain